MKTTFRFGRFPGLPVRTIVFLLVAGFGPFQLWSQTWTPVTLTAPHNNKGVMMLLSDGTVLCKTNSGGGDGRGNIYDKLTPNASGSYTSGTWSSIAPMANTRLYYSSQILKDGRMYVCGGEYGTGGSSGEVYNPTTNTWTNTPNPGGFVSDANSEILEDGRVLQNIVGGGSVSNKIYNPATNTFVSGPTAVGGANESAWLKLPDNTILYVTIGATTAQRYNPVTNTWIADANCPVALYDSYGYEMGGAFMLPDGRGFFIGATGHTAYYTPSGTTANGTWTAGPDIPGPRGVPDGPACMMRDGKILLVASPLPTAADHFPTPTTFWIFDYLTNTYTNITAPDGAASWNIPTYVCNMLQLPNGQVLFARFDNSQYYVFTPAGGALASGVPTISSISLIASNTYRITGTRFNGISQGANYGDDWQMSTNYPVIRLQNGSNVYYCRSYNWNSTGVRRGSLPDTAFFVTPGGLPAATYSLYVTANGIPSAPSTLVPNLVASVNINITSGTNPSCDGLPITFLATPNNGGASPTYQWKLNGNSILGATNSSYTTSTLIQGDVITCVMTASIVVTGSPATSNAFTMTINDNNAVISASATPNLMCKGEISSLSASAAYCIPSYGIGSGSGDYIGRVTLSGTALNNISGASSSPYYTLYPQSGSTTGSVTAGSTYTLTLSPGTFGSSNRLAAWIDYNQDKSFSGNEKLGEIVINASYPTTGTIVFTIPATAKNGTVRLRVREVYAVVNIEPCKPYTYGETEDYALTLSGGGAVVPIVYDWSTGSSGSLVTTVPAYSQTYTVTVTDVNGCPTHTSVPVVVNAPNATATATPQTICSGATASLSAAKVTAYCTPTYTYGTGSNDYISLVSISGTTLNSSTGASGSPYYTLYPASGSTTATLSAGSTYTLVLSPGTYPFYNGMAAFIDWDHDYIFNNGAEKIGETGYVNASPATASIVFTVPGWVKSGTTRLRVREAFATTTLDACTDYYYGETEDYVLTISGGVSEIPYVYAWTGGTTPTTGTPVSASPTNTTQYVVTATDQYGCSATASTAVIVAVPPVITMNPPSSSGICNGGSTTLSITEVTPTYCTPAYNSGTIDGDYIGSVSIAGTTLNNVTVGAVSPFYTLFPAFGSATATLTAGTTYTLSLSPGTYGSGNNMAAWLDYDQNGSFYDATEKLGELLNVGSFPGYGEIVFTIPSFVQNGTIRLRVREAWNTFGINACSTYNYGETEDYTLTITGGTAANNFTWSPATVPSSGASVVATPTYSQTYTVTASNATGCTSTSTVSIFVDAPRVAASLSNTSFCAGGSTTLTIDTAFCVPSYLFGSFSGDYISHVQIAGTTLNNTSGPSPSPFYTVYPASGSTTANLTAGTTYTLTLTCGSYLNSNGLSAWIDFDNNHEFNAGAELIGYLQNLGSFGSGNLVFTVPTWAVNGPIRLRVREVYYFSNYGPCDPFNYGETEEYILNISGGVNVPPLTYYLSSPEFAYQVVGMSTPLNPTYSQTFTVSTTDAYGCTASTNLNVEVHSQPLPFSIAASPATICSGSISVLTATPGTPSYCTPASSLGTGSGDYCQAFSISSTTLNNVSGSSVAPYYTLFPNSGSTTTNLTAGGTYTFNLTAGTYPSGNGFAVWIDYDHDGVLNNGNEKVVYVTSVNGNSTASVPVTIPLTALNGQTRLRVREVYTITPGQNSCNTATYGETEDYTITISGGSSATATYSWSPTTSPATGSMVNASPTSNTTYTATVSDAWGCTNTATVTVNMTTPASFTNNASTVCIGGAVNFVGNDISCSGNCFAGNGFSYSASASSTYATTVTTNLTMEAWVKWNGSTGSNQFIYYNGHSAANGYGIMLSSANANRIAVLLGGVAFLNSTVTLTPGLWQHVVVTRNASVWTLYVDGTAYTLTNNTLNPNVPVSGGTYVGRGFATEYFNGSIDEVRVFSILRNAAQIAADRTGCITAPQAGLAGYWKFNESTGTSCLDASGFGRTLFLANPVSRGISASYSWNFGDATTGSGINVSHAYASTGTYNATLTVTDITGCAASSTQAILINSCNSTLTLKFYLQGYYTGTGMMTPTLQNEGLSAPPTFTDTVVVELHAATAPYALVESYTGIVNINGNIVCTFSPARNGNSYYIVVKHRNTVQTWSASPVLFSSATAYDFTNAASKAYGNNQLMLAPGIYGLYSGDINLDENIDLLDMSILEADIDAFAFGYFATDINGDGNVDLLDAPVVDANVTNFIYSIHP